MDAFCGTHDLLSVVDAYSEYNGIFLFEFMVTCTKYMLCLYCLGAFIFTDDYVSVSIIFFMD